MKIIYSSFFSNRVGTVGLVITENQQGVRKLRCSPVFGLSEDRDKDLIAKWGSTIPENEVKTILEVLNET